MPYWAFVPVVNLHWMKVQSLLFSPLILVQHLTELTMKAFCLNFQAAGVGGSLLDVIRDFLSGRTQRVVEDGAQSCAVDLVSGVPQGSVLGQLLFSIYTRDLSVELANVLVGYADDSTLIAHVPHPSVRVAVVVLSTVILRV